VPERSRRTYGQLKEDFGDRAELVGRLSAAFELAEPDPALRLMTRDEALLVGLVDIALATGEPDLVVRSVRLMADATRRATEAVLSIYEEGIRHVLAPGEVLLSLDAFERFVLPWARFAQLIPELGEWLTARHLTNAIDASSVSNVEHSSWRRPGTSRHESRLRRQSPSSTCQASPPSGRIVGTSGSHRWRSTSRGCRTLMRRPRAAGW
jgi:hypothetical protein